MSTPAHTRNPHAYARSWCGVCGTELPRYTGAGRPRRYCDPSTGRPCKDHVVLVSRLAASFDKIAANTSSAKRETFLRGSRGTLRQMVEDLTLTIARLQGDDARAARVGDDIPVGFEGAIE